MRYAELFEGATLVRVIDPGDDRSHTYWVKQAKDETAIKNAIKKHKQRYGIGMRVGRKDIPDIELTAEIIKKI